MKVIDWSSEVDGLATLFKQQSDQIDSLLAFAALNLSGLMPGKAKRRERVDKSMDAMLKAMVQMKEVHDSMVELFVQMLKQAEGPGVVRER